METAEHFALGLKTKGDMIALRTRRQRGLSGAWMGLNKSRPYSSAQFSSISTARDDASEAAWDAAHYAAMTAGFFAAEEGAARVDWPANEEEWRRFYRASQFAAEHPDIIRQAEDAARAEQASQLRLMLGNPFAERPLEVGIDAELLFLWMNERIRPEKDKARGEWVFRIPSRSEPATLSDLLHVHSSLPVRLEDAEFDQDKSDWASEDSKESEDNGEELPEHLGQDQMSNPLCNEDEDEDEDDEAEREKAIKWERFLETLKRSFQTPRIQESYGKVLVTETPLDLKETPLAVAETDKARQHIEDVGASDVLKEGGWSTGTLLYFEWSSLGPMAWSAWLCLLDVGDSRTYVFYSADDEPDLVIAALEPRDSKELFSTFFRDLIAENGEAYHVSLLGSLPSRTENCRPDFLPADVVKDGYWDWMEWASKVGLSVSSWASLRNRVIGELVKEPFRTGGELLEEALQGLPPQPSAEQLDLWFKRRKEKIIEETARLTMEDRRRILDVYFYTSYKEHGTRAKN